MYTQAGTSAFKTHSPTRIFAAFVSVSRLLCSSGKKASFARLMRILKSGLLSTCIKTEHKFLVFLTTGNSFPRGESRSFSTRALKLKKLRKTPENSEVSFTPVKRSSLYPFVIHEWTNEVWLVSLNEAQCVRLNGTWRIKKFVARVRDNGIEKCTSLKKKMGNWEGYRVYRVISGSSNSTMTLKSEVSWHEWNTNYSLKDERVLD